MSPPRIDQPFVVGVIHTPAGKIPQVTAKLSVFDLWGACKVRLSLNRLNYKVDAGLYALGQPDDQSLVIVTANYKLSFDRLRETLAERNIWMLVLDTGGINVWCSASKGIFGTEELARRIHASRLHQIVSHRELILPQLAGPGVASHIVRNLSGFRVIYGPIRSKDLPAFIDTGLKATAEMRRKRFTIKERAVLIPVEIISALKPGLITMVIFVFMGGVGGSESFWGNALNHGLFTVLCLSSAIAAGTIFTPLMLPWLPGRAFSFKGLTMGLIVLSIIFIFRLGDLNSLHAWLEIAGWFLIVPALSAYLAMNFTGASTYTSLSGVKKEMRWAVPLEVAGAVLGVALWFGSRFIV